MFRTKFEDRKPIYSEAGDPIKIEYGAKYDKKNNLVVEKKGTSNLYAYINSFKDSVDINVLLARFTNGDKEALNQRAANYLDISSVPSNIHEYIDFQRSCENLYNTLPVEIKEKFGNNMLQFMSQVGDPEWNEIMNISQAKIKEDISAESKKVAELNKQLVKENIVENPGIDVIEKEPIKGGKL